MRSHLVTFSDASMERSAELCVRSAEQHGVDDSLRWRYEDFLRTDFYLHNQALLSQPRGLGFWAWKPWIILKALEGKMTGDQFCHNSFYPPEENDILIYSDAGVEFTNNINHIIDRMDQDIFLFGNQYEHAHWCKADIVHEIWPSGLRDRNNPGWLCFGKQVQAGVIFFRVNDKTRAFVKEWLDWCLFEGGRLIDDSPSRAPNHPEFKENRHDQAILTTMAYRDGYRLHYWRASYNDGAFEYPRGDYPDEGYPILFAHHRFKPPTIAVLPFVNATGDSSLDSAGDSLTEGIIQSLSQINAPSKLPRLLVAPLFSVTTFKGRQIDPRQAGREMGVDFVLAGNITENNKVLTTKVEVIKVSDGSLVWGAQNSEFSLVSMELPEKIAQETAQKLQLRLSNEERLRLTKRYTQNAAAYQAYIKGNVLFGSRPASLKGSAEYYQQAINLDPDFALPYSQMGGVRQLLAVYGMTPPRESYQEANAWWAKALQRDSSLVVVHIQMQAQKFWFDWDWEGIEKSGKRTGVYFDYLGAMGRVDESLAANKKGQAWMPTSAVIAFGVGFDLYLMHRYDEAISQFKKAISLDPDNWPAHFFLGFTYSQKGMHEEAIAEMQRSIELQENAPPSVAGLGYAYAMSGRRDGALKILNQLQERANHGEYVWPLGAALIQIGLGNKDDALVWLDKAYEDHSTGMNYLKVNPLYDPLRSDPRFTNLLRRMRFPA